MLKGHTQQYLITFFNLDVIQHEIEVQATISFFLFFFLKAALWLWIIFADIYDQGAHVKNPHVMLLLIQLARPEGFMKTEKTDYIAGRHEIIY